MDYSSPPSLHWNLASKKRRKVAATVDRALPPLPGMPAVTARPAQTKEERISLVAATDASQRILALLFTRLFRVMRLLLSKCQRALLITFTNSSAERPAFFAISFAYAGKTVAPTRTQRMFSARRKFQHYLYTLFSRGQVLEEQFHDSTSARRYCSRWYKSLCLSQTPQLL